MVLRTGNPPRGTKRKPAPPPKRPKTVIDEEALAAIKIRFEEERVEAEKQRARTTGGGRVLTATGHCHDCGKAITGERRFCGRCLAAH